MSDTSLRKGLGSLRLFQMAHNVVDSSDLVESSLDGKIKSG